MLKRLLFVSLVGWLLMLSTPLAYGALSLPEAPTTNTYVFDYAGVLNDSTEQQLNSSLAQFEKDKTTEIAVVTVSSLQDYPIEDYSIELARKWGIGQKGSNNGALLLIAPNEKNLRIEVGYGLEGALTDSISSRIINQVMIPSLRYDDYDKAVLDGANAIMLAVQGEEFATVPDYDQMGPWWDVLIILIPFSWLILSWFSGSKGWWAGGIFGAVFGFLVYALNGLLAGLFIGLFLDFVLSKFFFGKIKASDGPSFWDFFGGGSGGGFSGGSGGGFGGGGFGGGGASGRW